MYQTLEGYCGTLFNVYVTVKESFLVLYGHVSLFHSRNCRDILQLAVKLFDAITHPLHPSNPTLSHVTTPQRFQLHIARKWVSWRRERTLIQFVDIDQL